MGFGGLEVTEVISATLISQSEYPSLRNPHGHTDTGTLTSSHPTNEETEAQRNHTTGHTATKW